MSVTPNVRNCCDLALTKCLKIHPCSHFCLQARLCAGMCPSAVSHEGVNGGSGGSAGDYDGAKLSFDQSSRCCGTVKVGDNVTVILRNTTVDEGGWTIAKIEAGKITLRNANKGYLVLNGINGHLCSVFYDSSATDICAICPEHRYDIARTTKTGPCSAASCNQCSC